MDRDLAVSDRCLARAHRQLASIAKRYLTIARHLNRVASYRLNKAGQGKMKARGLSYKNKDWLAA